MKASNVYDSLIRFEECFASVLSPHRTPKLRETEHEKTGSFLPVFATSTSQACGGSVLFPYGVSGP
jgi:hypothetical protein